MCLQCFSHINKFSFCFRLFQGHLKKLGNISKVWKVHVLKFLKNCNVQVSFLSLCFGDVARKSAALLHLSDAFYVAMHCFI